MLTYCITSKKNLKNFGDILFQFNFATENFQTVRTPC